MCEANTYLTELKNYAPQIFSACELAIKSAKKDMDFVRIDPSVFHASPSDSIDYAVLEKSSKVAVIPLEPCGWSDWGSWDTIYEGQEKDDHKNVIIGDVYTDKVNQSYVQANHRLVVALGISD